MGADWTNFFVAQVSASSALLGLLFIGVSLNLQRILASRNLPRRALLALGLLLTVLVAALVMLMPVGEVVRGGLVLALGGGMLLAGNLIQLARYRTVEEGDRLFLLGLFLFELAAIPYLAGGVLLVARVEGGASWLAAGMILSIIKAMADAWVMLVEINR